MSTQPHPVHVGVHELVGAQARRTPSALALVAAESQWTYRELDTRANQLAHLLRSLGVGPDVPVGLCAGRSVDLVVGALGILKAGGAYVPLDPAYPANRLSMLLNDSQAPVLVTHPGVADQLPSGNWRTVVVEADGMEGVRYPSVPPVVETKAGDLAYIIFTSGSTGRPKGVQIPHASLLNLVVWHQRTFGITPADRATLHASPGFDAAVWEVWPYLTAGASLYLVDDAVRHAPEPLRDWMVAQGITISFLPTALAQYMVDLEWPRETALRVLLTGADTLRRYPPATLPFALVNNYGPTECTVVATSGTVPPGEGEGELPPIGRPIDNTHVYIVDEQFRPVPAGTPGEMLIGGAGVARGYLHLPELTAERFLPDPFSQDPGARLYRTGDLARALPDGQIAFLGRLDDQVKILGYRIEPQEIATVLDRHPSVSVSLVVAHSDASGEKRLVAYVVPAAEARLNASALRTFLSESLPEYMIPALFVPLVQLPLSSHGKLDRAALPEPTPENTLEDAAFEAPRSQTEECVAGILTALLGGRRVGMDDNFFNMGGHSLLGAQTIARIRETFGVELSLRSLFDDPTVRGISAEIERLILAKVEAMSEDEAQRILASVQGGAKR
jgi:amino acid adenylation domain-containing protein